MSFLKKFCQLTDTQITVLSGFDLEFGVLLKDIKDILVMNEASLTRAKDTLIRMGFIEESSTYYDFDQKKELEIKDKRKKAYKLVRNKEIQALEQLLYTLYLTTKIHNNMLRIVRDMFPYKENPMEIDVFSLQVIRKRIDRILRPQRILYIFKTDIFNELKVELNKWKRFFERDSKKSNRIQRFFDRLQGNPIDDWMIFNSELQKHRKDELELINKGKNGGG